MENNVFMDTNILLYAYSDTEIERKETALSLLEQEKVYFSTQVINEFIWIMNRKFNVNMNSLKLISEGIFEMYKVVLIDKASITTATDISSKYKFSYWDSLMIASAIASNCNILYTEDLQHGQVIENRLTVINPFM
jgi:predicted nucleic acid-binding protein